MSVDMGSEKLERELSVLFRDAAERVDLTPPTAARRPVRRGTAAVAAVAVLAILAGVGVAGVRLSSGGADGSPSLAAPGPAQAVLAAVDRMMRGRWEVTTTTPVDAGSSSIWGGPEPSATAHPDVTVSDVDVDHGVAVTRRDGTVVTIATRERVLNAIRPDLRREAALHPHGAVLRRARWWALAMPAAFRTMPAAEIGMGLQAGGWTLLGEIRGVLAGSRSPVAATMTANPRIVRTGDDGFRVTWSQPGGVMSDRLDVRLRAGIVVEIRQTVVAAPARLPAGFPRPSTAMQITATFAPLAGTVAAPAVDPNTVISQRQFYAAIGIGSHSQVECPGARVAPNGRGTTLPPGPSPSPGPIRCTSAVGPVRAAG